MFGTLQQILLQTWQNLVQHMLTFVPNLLAMLLILAIGWLVARVLQWAVSRMSAPLGRSLRRWGVADRYGDEGAPHLVARGVFWIVFLCAALMGVDALNTQLGSRLVTSAFLFLPRLLAAGLIVLGGLLLGRFLARGALIWAVNEGIGPARLIASAVRLGIGALTFVAAAEQIGVARTAVLAAFVILLSATLLTAAIAIGLGSRKRVERWLDRRAEFLGEQRQEEEHLQHL